MNLISHRMARAHYRIPDVLLYSLDAFKANGAPADNIKGNNHFYCESEVRRLVPPGCVPEVIRANMRRDMLSPDMVIASRLQKILSRIPGVVHDHRLRVVWSREAQLYVTGMFSILSIALEAEMRARKVEDIIQIEPLVLDGQLSLDISHGLFRVDAPEECSKVFVTYDMSLGIHIKRVYSLQKQQCISLSVLSGLPNDVKALIWDKARTKKEALPTVTSRYGELVREFGDKSIHVHSLAKWIASGDLGYVSKEDAFGAEHRFRMLRRRLADAGLSFRFDSRLCVRYINSGINTVDEVVLMMKEMEWFFSQTNYRKFALSNQYASEDAKLRAVSHFVVRKRRIPEELPVRFVRYAKRVLAFRELTVSCFDWWSMRTNENFPHEATEALLVAKQQYFENRQRIPDIEVALMSKLVASYAVLRCVDSLVGHEVEVELKVDS